MEQSFFINPTTFDEIESQIKYQKTVRQAALTISLQQYLKISEKRSATHWTY